MTRDYAAELWRNIDLKAYLEDQPYAQDIAFPKGVPMIGRDSRGLPVVSQMPVPPKPDPVPAPAQPPPATDTPADPVLPIVGDPDFWQLLPEVIIVNLLDPIHWLAILPVLAAFLSAFLSHLPADVPPIVMAVLFGLDAALQAYQSSHGAGNARAVARRARGKIIMHALQELAGTTGTFADVPVKMSHPLVTIRPVERNSVESLLFASDVTELY